MDKSTLLENVMSEERTRLFGSFAVHNTLKETGTMQTTNQTIAASVEKEVSDQALQEFIAKTGITDANLDGPMGDPETYQAPKPLTKKQLKQAKYAQKNMMAQLRGYQRQGQARHIMGKLFQHSIRTPEQARHIHAHDLAKQELVVLLGERQANAFFAANADTRTHDFFPKATIAANPKLMTAANGEARTLAEVFEYFIYKQFMILTEKANATVAEPLNTTIDWAAIGDIPQYVPYEGDETFPREEGKSLTTEAMMERFNEEVSTEAPQAEETSEEIPAAPVS